MSQEAEYFLRNIGRGAQGIARRIAEQRERSQSERRLHQWWQQQANRLEGRLHGEVVGLRDEMVRRHTNIASQIECNRRLTEAVQQQAGEALAEQQHALNVLAEYDKQLQSQLVETIEIQTRLAERLAATETTLQADIAERQAERTRNANHAHGLRRVVADSIGRIDNRRALAVGLGVDVDALRVAAQRADQIAGNPSQELAAVALYSEALNQVDRLQLELHRRETEIARSREVARLNVASAGERLDGFATDPEATEAYARVISALREDIRTANLRLASLETTTGADFGRQLAQWDQMAEAATGVADRVEQLWRERDQVLDQIRQRNRMVEDVMKSLIEVWGATFEVEAMYAVTDDPRSTLMLQSQRKHGRNVTIHLDLDGRMQISFTGYVGMQCTKDVEEFRRHLEQSGDLQVQHVGTVDHPDQPNPPGVDGGPTAPPIYRPPAATKKTERPREH